jgi:UDP-glucose 4-epimerase
MAAAKKTVLVTGAAGFVGQATVLALAHAGWQVTGGVRSAAQPLGDGQISLDLSQPAAILALAGAVRFDAIVHLGAHVGLSGSAEAEMFVPNVLATGCLVHLASCWEAPLIFASTAIVHGVKTERIESDSPPLPDTPYANGKLLGEQLLVASHVRHCILRIAGIFGHAGPAHLGLNRAIDGALKGDAPIQIGLGEALRNYVYVKDVAQAIAHALQEDLAGTHLLAGHEVMPIGGMLQAVCDAFLPGQHPSLQAGTEAISQVIKPSPFLPQTRSFRDALIDIRKESRQ